MFQFYDTHANRYDTRGSWTHFGEFECTRADKCCMTSRDRLIGAADVANPRAETLALSDALCCCFMCACPRVNSISASFTVCVVLFAYIVLGGFVFMSLEGEDLSLMEGLTANSSRSIEMQMAADIRLRTVERLWGITEDLNILYKDNWTRLASQQVLDFQEAVMRNLRYRSRGRIVVNKEGTVFYHQEHRWSFSSSLLYSLTLITTIGYGGIVPKTQFGKIVTIVYAFIGIPLMLVYLSTIGDILARGARCLYHRICYGDKKEYNPRRLHSQPNQYVTNNAKRKFYYCENDYTAASVRPAEYNATILPRPFVPIIACVLIIGAYIVVGAVLLHQFDNLSILDGTYVCFTSLSTIAFNDAIPYGDQLSHGVCAGYIILGMALVAMCFNLIHDQIVQILGKLLTNKRDINYMQSIPLTS